MCKARLLECLSEVPRNQNHRKEILIFDVRKVGSYCEQLPSVGWCCETGGQREHVHHQQVLQPLVCVITGATQQVRYTLTLSTMKLQSQVVTIKSTAALTKHIKNQ